MSPGGRARYGNTVSRVIYASRKVPEVTIFFWIIKILTTGMGETTSDFLVRTIDPVIAVAFGGLWFALALALQFLVRRYIPAVYWLAVVMVGGLALTHGGLRGRHQSPSLSPGMSARRHFPSIA